MKNNILWKISHFIKGKIIENYVMDELIRNNIKPYFHTFKFETDGVQGTNQYELDCVYEYKLDVHVLEIKSGTSRKSPSIQKLKTINNKVLPRKLSLNSEIDEFNLPLYLAFTIGKDI